MERPIRDKIAHKMWKMWQDKTPLAFNNEACPEAFYAMAQLAMEETKEEFTRMVDAVIKDRLNDLYDNS